MQIIFKFLIGYIAKRGTSDTPTVNNMASRVIVYLGSNETGNTHYVKAQGRGDSGSGDANSSAKMHHYISFNGTKLWTFDLNLTARDTTALCTNTLAKKKITFDWNDTTWVKTSEEAW